MDAEQPSPSDPLSAHSSESPFNANPLPEGAFLNPIPIDALSTHVCVLDETGTILAVNQAWKAFADANPPVPEAYGVGENYLELCERATGVGAEEAAPFAAGVRAVIGGAQNEFLMEYPWGDKYFRSDCHLAWRRGQQESSSF
jgi:hypothetical protein